MKNTQNAESFVGIIVGIFILSFVVLGIVNVLTYSIGLTTQYEDANRILILKENLTNTIKKIDTSMLAQNEIFYIHKNRATGEFEIIRPEECISTLPVGSDESICHSYRYIDELGDTIPDITAHEGNIYSQLLWVSTEDNTFGEANQVIRASVMRLRKK
ncbi:hypothetical protein LAT59_04680 [Candidatus Gracilibacteria bacterium]|nr:hypothetical protein [Candidatus Gracilibacteria bacterium]